MGEKYGGAKIGTDTIYFAFFGLPWAVPSVSCQIFS